MTANACQDTITGYLEQKDLNHICCLLVAVFLHIKLTKAIVIFE